MQDDSHDYLEMNTKIPEDFSHKKGDINQIRKQSKHEDTQKDNNSSQNVNKQPNGCGFRQLNTELGIAKKENTPEPLQVCTSFRTSNATPNSHAYPLSEVNVEQNNINSVGNCLQSCRTDHDCSEAEPELMGVPERQSGRIWRNAATGASRCYQAVKLGFLQCLEDTPFVVPGLVLTILFCVTIIIVIAATGRVSKVKELIN